jgi:hypothetical protein
MRDPLRSRFVRSRLLRSRFLRSRVGIVAIAGLILILFLFRPGVYKLRNRISTSIGNALGRRVSLDNVRLRLLPRPGFDLEGLVIYDDPAFSAEPMIRAQEVSAAIRLRSLLRGRLEIATLSATEPSINLVRNSEGQWNLARLIERNAQIPAAPTGKPASERRPAFPYLEASNARVNFKIAQTKKSLALINADVALWQDSENSWGARMTAEPVRTDFNLTDTGLLQVNATWQRAASLRSTPLQMDVRWRNAQLGQVTKLFSGKDRGWRGSADFTARITGTPEDLNIATTSAIDSFHRYDIVGSENVRLAIGCAGRYNAIERSLSDLLCESPVAGGEFRLRGNVAMISEEPTYDLMLAAEKLPLTSVVRWLHQAKKLIPGDAIATGLLNAEFHATRQAKSFPAGARQNLVESIVQTVSGTGVATDVSVSWNSGKDKVDLGTVPLALISSSVGVSKASTGSAKTQKNQGPSEVRLRLGPTTLAINDSAPLEAGGWLSTQGYQFSVRGDINLRDLFRLESVVGLPVMRPAANGAATLDVGISGPWRGFAPAVVAGTLQLRNVRAEVHGLNTPIEISSAFIAVSPDQVSMQRISARTGNTHWSGGITAPRHCAIPSVAPNADPAVIPNCVFQFDLSADQLSTGDLTDWFAPHSAKRPWYRILESTNMPPGPSPLLAIQAHGMLHVASVEVKKLVAAHVATQLEFDRGKVTLNAVCAQFLQGTHQGEWTIDFSDQDASNYAVQYKGAGTLQNISLTQMTTLMNDDWITGTADGKFEVEGSANSFQELMDRSNGRLQFVMRNGSLPHIELPAARGPLPVFRFAGDLRLKKGAWNLPDGKLESRDGVYQVRGTNSPADGLDFVMTRGDDQSWTLTGTLADPHVSGRGESKTTQDLEPTTDKSRGKPPANSLNQHLVE